jgi:exopolyphosphatase/guanosine-5'-triphosphate,3'-diphosphate pyrophosphatase
MARHETLAAVDLGSNSFHLLVGRIVDGQIYPLDTLREQTQLAAGLTADKRLDRASQARALEVLAQFRERLRGLPRDAVRAVGTNALRIAKNSAASCARRARRSGFRLRSSPAARMRASSISASRTRCRRRRTSASSWTSAAARRS